jgi:hypothetical protein
MPNALMAMIEIDPTVLHMEMYTNGFFLPYFGAILYIMTNANTETMAQ